MGDGEGGGLWVSGVEWGEGHLSGGYRAGGRVRGRGEGGVLMGLLWGWRQGRGGRQRGSSWEGSIFSFFIAMLAMIMAEVVHP